ncbi:MAG: lysine exporter LysO family protein [Tissierellia bacterium]|jgi:uncharacterized membrane protein YbjE (DUF340 family)|nr:lysine exporter LysO family protein [Tissierellia bacterium]
MSELALFFGIALIGYLLGSRFSSTLQEIKLFQSIQTIAVIILIFSMGLRVGINKEVTSQLGTIGIYAFIITLVVMFFSVLFVYFTRRLMGIDRYGLMKNERATPQRGELKAGLEEEQGGQKIDRMMIVILITIAFGIFGGFLLSKRIVLYYVEIDFVLGLVIMFGLSILLFFIGLDLGIDGTVVENFKKVGLRVLAIPLAIIAGTLVGAFFCGIFFRIISVKETLAVGAGFGWYSLSPALIIKEGFIIAGAISFLHNVMREVLAIFIIPFVAKYIGYVECCALPGSSAMDICLPIIIRATSENTAIYSFITGIVLSAVVPILIPLIL